jgi:hypothetical protein
MAYLRERELVTNVYKERRLQVRLRGGGNVEAVSYVVDREHRQYAGHLSAVEAAVRVGRGRTFGRQRGLCAQHGRASGGHAHPRPLAGAGGGLIAPQRPPGKADAQFG